MHFLTQQDESTLIELGRTPCLLHNNSGLDNADVASVLQSRYDQGEQERRAAAAARRMATDHQAQEERESMERVNNELEARLEKSIIILRCGAYSPIVICTYCLLFVFRKHEREEDDKQQAKRQRRERAQNKLAEARNIMVRHGQPPSKDVFKTATVPVLQAYLREAYNVPPAEMRKLHTRQQKQDRCEALWIAPNSLVELVGPGNFHQAQPPDFDSLATAYERRLGPEQ